MAPPDYIILINVAVIDVFQQGSSHRGGIGRQ
jgi:hypothetical protein